MNALKFINRYQYNTCDDKVVKNKHKFVMNIVWQEDNLKKILQMSCLVLPLI